MSDRLKQLLDDLNNMPGVNAAFLYCREGIIATTVDDPRQQDRVGRIYLNIMSGAFTLGHFVREIYCDFDKAVIMIRPVGRGCILVAICDAGVSTGLVDISLTMTAKSVEDEINALEDLPRPITSNPANDLGAAMDSLEAGAAASGEELEPERNNDLGRTAPDDDDSEASEDRPATDGMLETHSKG